MKTFSLILIATFLVGCSTMQVQGFYYDEENDVYYYDTHFNDENTYRCH